jgi:hypothetical protein
MKNRKVRFFALYCLAVFLLVLSCKSAPPAQEDLDRLNVAKARAQASREKAVAVRGQVYFPEEWKKAEADYNTGRNSGTETLVQVNEAITLLTSAADDFDSIAEKSGPRLAKDTEDARVALEEARARAETARQKAQGSGGEKYFPEEWQSAEERLAAAKEAGTDSYDELKSAASQFDTMTNMYDDIARRSGPRKDLDDAIARTEAARQKAADVDGPVYFREYWEAAEAAFEIAKVAETETLDDMTAAAGQFDAATEMYDDIAGRSGPQFAKDRDDAARALQAAVARAEASRRAASGANGQNNFPNEWRDAETKNQTAQSAAKATVAEMKAATPLYNTAADAYDNIARLNTARAAEEGRRNMNNAKAQADRARQAAVDARANVAVPDDFNRADGIYRQATTAFNANSFGPATDGFNQAAAQFTAAANAVAARRRQAEEALAGAKNRAAQSVAHATNVGRIMDGNTEGGNE